MPKYATIFTPTPRGVTTFALVPHGVTTFALASRGTTTFSKVASGEIPSSGYRLGRSAYALTGSGLGIALGRGVAIGRSALTVHGNALTVNVGYGATMGISTLRLAAQAPTLRVGHTLAASSSALTINGRPLAFAASGAFTGIMGAAALHLAPHQLAPVASVNAAAGATTLTHTSKTLGVTASATMISSASAMGYVGSMLGVATTSAVSFSGAVGTGSVALNPRTLSVTAGTSFVGALTPSHLTLTTKTPMASTSQVLDMAELSIIIAGSLQQVVATAGMTLTGTIPAGTVGGTVDAHLTLGGDITYPVTISGLPSWIDDPGSIVSGTDVHLTGTYPATAGTETFTVTATDSSVTPQTATSEQSVVVSAAAASAPSVVQTSQALWGSTGQYTFDSSSGWAAPTAGHTLLLVQNSSTAAASTPAGWTLIQQNLGVGVNRNVNMYLRAATAADSTVSVDCGGHGNAALFELDTPIALDDTPLNGTINSYSATVDCGTPTGDHRLAFAVSALANPISVSTPDAQATAYDFANQGSSDYWFTVGVFDTGTSRADETLGFTYNGSAHGTRAGMLLRAAS